MHVDIGLDPFVVIIVMFLCRTMLYAFLDLVNASIYSHHFRMHVSVQQIRSVILCGLFFVFLISLKQRALFSAGYEKSAATAWLPRVGEIEGAGLVQRSPSAEEISKSSSISHLAVSVPESSLAGVVDGETSSVRPSPRAVPR